jgi:TonB-dependent SusC/RagA subfamily outer membrane receptor
MRKITMLLVFLLFAGLQVVLAQKTVTGTVTGASDSQPLAGVTVLLRGTTVGALTGVNGSYSIQVPNNESVLVFSFIGFTTQEITVGSQTVVNVVLAESMLQMDEVVVTALGISREKKSLGYAVATVDSKVLMENKSISVAQSLDGRVAGLNINVPTSGAGSSVAITLRGSGSPLLVVNGLPLGTAGGGNSGIGRDRGNDFNLINPDDIETMTVLKGATAAALYGSRASNGAILITTKSGAGQGIGLEYTSSFQAQEMLDYFEYQDLFGQGDGGKKPTTVGVSTGSSQYGWGAPYDGLPYPIFDGSEVPYSFIGPKITEYYRIGKTLTNTVAFSGSTGGSPLSLGHLHKPLKGLFSIVTSDSKFQHIIKMFTYQIPLTKGASLPGNDARKVS